MCRQLISANGKAGRTPEVGFILGDDADPMALASVTSQVFMGVRIACAQCHDHPFDVWKREQFYGLAAFFGKTRRVESELDQARSTPPSTNQNAILWPPARPRLRRQAQADHSRVSRSRWTAPTRPPSYIARLADLRDASKADKAKEGPLARRPAGRGRREGAEADRRRSAGAGRRRRAKPSGDAAEPEREGRPLPGQRAAARAGELVTSPRNRYFSRVVRQPRLGGAGRPRLCRAGRRFQRRKRAQPSEDARLTWPTSSWPAATTCGRWCGSS